MRVFSRSSVRVCAAAVVLGAAAAGGCVPTVYNKRPDVRGTVRDLAGAPIPGATVRVTRADKPDPRGAAAARSDAAGEFRVPPARKFGVYWFMQDEGRWTWNVEAEAPGHTPAFVELTHRGQMPKAKFDNVRFKLPPK